MPGVDLLGDVQPAPLDELYNGATFHVTPSIPEGFGYPPLEAMARCVPTIASTGSAMDETLGDAALRVHPLDVTGWADAMTSFATDEDARVCLVTAGREVAARFSWTRTADAYAQIYRDALGI